MKLTYSFWVRHVNPKGKKNKKIKIKMKLKKKMYFVGFK